jgi:hypothetical protein
MLRCFLRDPKFANALQTWHEGYEDDIISDVAPLVAFPDCNTIMNGIFDAALWRTQDATRTRSIQNGVVRECAGEHLTRLVSLKFGLLAAVNVDW